MSRNCFPAYLIQAFWVFLLTSAFFINNGCKTFNPYVNNDSTAIYSTHPSRPFKYGYAYTKQQCTDSMSEYISDFQIQNGDIVADVGAASGWIEGVLSVFTDSVTYYVEDVNSRYSNQSELDKVVRHYSEIRETPQTNIFHLVQGTKTKTNLPDSIFDKVILNNAFHEFSLKKTMLRDISKKLNSNGKLIIREGFSSEFKNRKMPGCNLKALRVKTIKAFCGKFDLYLTNMTYPENSFSNCLTFQKNKSLSDDFNLRIKSVEEYTKILDQLNKNSIARDSNKTKAIAEHLAENIDKLNAVYRSVEGYINVMGYDQLKVYRYKSAINIFKVNLRLYPGSYNVYDSLGEAYLKNKQFDQALNNYEMSLEINPYNLNAQKKIKMIKSKLLSSKK